MKIAVILEHAKGEDTKEIEVTIPNGEVSREEWLRILEREMNRAYDAGCTDGALRGLDKGVEIASLIGEMVGDTM